MKRWIKKCHKARRKAMQRRTSPMTFDDPEQLFLDTYPGYKELRDACLNAPLNMQTYNLPPALRNSSYDLNYAAQRQSGFFRNHVGYGAKLLKPEFAFKINDPGPMPELSPEETVRLQKMLDDLADDLDKNLMQRYSEAVAIMQAAGVEVNSLTFHDEISVTLNYTATIPADQTGTWTEKFKRAIHVGA